MIDRKYPIQLFTFYFLLFTFSLSESGCRNSLHDTNSILPEKMGEEINIVYAKGFRIVEFPGYTKINVHNPWQGAENVSFTYYLVKSEIDIPKELSGKIVIRTPVKRIVCLSTTHIALLEFVDEISSLVGMSSPQFVTNKEVINALKTGKIIDVGYEKKLDFEKIVHLNPDLVLAYGIGSEVTGYMKKLNELGITVVLNGEYLEKEPLAKAEWVKFIAAFYNKENVTSGKFDKLAQQYNSLRDIASKEKDKPLVLTGLPWKGVWYVPGGESFAAQFIKDAGGSYLWDKNRSTEALPLDMETVYEKALKADCWINPGAASSIKDILRVDKRLGELDVIQKDVIFNNNAVVNKNGGNDYWESGVTNPHLILKDLVKIFHPELLPDHNFVYYKKVEK
ncbi:MAG: ABC transporter substrate-binding protein [Bacteroidales bacterium]|nr:ABC transporter substrate-binding protein [Bacteroidales bacterium]